MGVTITAVPAVGTEPPSPPSNTERDLQDFAASVRSSPMAGLPQAANPASLAGDIVGGLKGYFDRAQTYQNRIISRAGVSSGDGVKVASLGDPADLGDVAGIADPGETEAGGDFKKVGLADLERAQELALQSQLFLAETTVVTHAASYIPHSINTLIKGQ